MRDLKECKAEVFRRSENRIKARKKLRNRVLSLCIPVCLVIGALLILPGLPSQQKNASHSEGIRGEQGKVDNTTSIVCTYTKVEILNAGQKPIAGKTVTDKVEVTKIFNAIGRCFPADYDEQQSPNASKGPGFDSAAMGITIVFTDDAGNRETYNLNGMVLVNLDKNTEVILTADQHTELETALELASAYK